MQKKLLVAALGTLFAIPALADSAPADASAVSVTGYLDAGYTNMNSTGLFGTNANNSLSRVFDTPKASIGNNFSGLNLNQAAITVSDQPKEGLGGVLNLTGGQDANVIASYGAGNLGGNAYNNNHSLDITQAYGSYVAGPWTIIAGKFVTLAGAETINGTTDTNYSRSILFGYAIPFTHTGARVTYAASDAVSLIVGVNQGWDQVKDTNSDKTVELGFTATPSKMFSLAGSYYGGKELASGFAGPLNQTTNGSRQLYDLVGTINATDQLSFVLNYDNGSQDKASTADANGNNTAKWDGLAAYANYQFSEKWHASFRTEYLNDKDGYRTGTVQNWKENTLTVAYLPTKTLELRGEIRGDSSDKSVFLNSNGTSKSNQTSYGLEALYKF